MKVLIEAQETVAYSRVVEMDADEFKKYCAALDGSFRSNREAAEKIMGLYIDRRNDWQEDSEHEITTFDVFTEDGSGDDSEQQQKPNEQAGS